MKEKLQKIIKSFNLKNLTGNNVWNPNRDWRILFFSLVVVNLIIALFCLRMFGQINEGKFYSIGEIKTTTVATIDEKQLTDIVSFFETKKENVSVLKQNKVNNVDPSL